VVARTFRPRARRVPGACPKYYAGNNIEAKVALAKPDSQAVNFPLCLLFKGL